MDPGTGTGLTVLGTAIGSKNLVERVLGPTADYLGEELKGWTEKRVENVARIFKKADKKLGDEVEEDGAVPPRVMKGVIDEGSYFDNELGAEYFGGVVAASRSTDGLDDRGATFTKLLGRLSSYQIAAHYFTYTVTRRLYLGADVNMGNETDRNRMDLFAPFAPFEMSIGIDGRSNSKARSILSHVMFGLTRDSLLQSFKYGDNITSGKEGSKLEGVKFTPSAFGSELYLWVHGIGSMHPKRIVDGSIDLESSIDITVTDNIQHIGDSSIATNPIC
jgi:hypothetical protein